MGFASIEDTLALEKEMSWEQRDVAKTLFGLLSDCLLYTSPSPRD